MSEREQIVAWLREQIDTFDTGEMSEHGGGIADAVRRFEELLTLVERGFPTETGADT